MVRNLYKVKGLIKLIYEDTQMNMTLNSAFHSLLWIQNA
jgi:hypothetical protein